VFTRLVYCSPYVGAVKEKMLETSEGMQKHGQDSADEVSEDPEELHPRKEARFTWEAGVDYEVREEANLEPDIVVLPELEEMQSFRHRWILRRRKRPMVPAPSHTPMPDKETTKEGKGRLFSLYMRPWVLDRRFASRHVPHIADLDVVFDKEARAFRVAHTAAHDRRTVLEGSIMGQ